MTYLGYDYGQYIHNDTLLLRWYGTNPRAEITHIKFEPMFLGLSKRFHQAKCLQEFQALNHFQNSFRNSNNIQNQTVVLNRDVFINFGSRTWSGRLPLFHDLCQDRTHIPPNMYLSCNNTKRAKPHDIYQQASHFSFAISPPGIGWDCYRTYELLYLGIIPIIERRTDDSNDSYRSSVTLFDDLPVIQIDREQPQKAIASNRVILAAIQDYLSRSPPNVRAPGWNRLFLAYWRREVLRDAKRETFYRNGKECYIRWKYELSNPLSPFHSQGGVYCIHGDACLADQEEEFNE